MKTISLALANQIIQRILIGWKLMQIDVLEFNRDIVNSLFHIKKIVHVQEERNQPWQPPHIKSISVKAD